MTGVCALVAFVCAGRGPDRRPLGTRAVAARLPRAVRARRGWAAGEHAPVFAAELTRGCRGRSRSRRWTRAKCSASAGRPWTASSSRCGRSCSPAPSLLSPRSRRFAGHQLRQVVPLHRVHGRSVATRRCEVGQQVLGRGEGLGAGSAVVLGYCWLASCSGVGISARMRYSERRASVRTR